MNEYLYLDLECIPAQRPDVLAEISESKQATLAADLANIKPPGNYKKQETIDEWMAQEAPKQAQALRDAVEADIDAAYRKTGLDGAYGQICVIGFAVDDAAPRTVWSSEWAKPDCEQELLEDFYLALNSAVSPSFERTITVVGHNVANFDLRFMVQRSIVRGVRPHGIIARAAQAKPWEADKVFDTMVQWAGVGNRISLDKLCKVLGIQSPKSDITGATVWDAVQADRIAEVAAYCAGDVVATREVHRRLTFRTAPVVAFEDVPA